MRQGTQSVALEIAWEEDTLVHLSHLFSVEPDIHQADETADTSEPSSEDPHKVGPGASLRNTSTVLNMVLPILLATLCLAGLAVHGTHPTTTTHQHGPLKNSVVSVSKFGPDGFSPVWHNDIIEEDRSAVSRVMQAEVKQNSCRGHVRAFHNSADGKFPAIDTVLSTPATENAAHEIDKTLEFFSVVTMALSVLHLSYLVNEIFLSTVSHQRHVEQGKHGITPVMIEVNGPEVLGTYNLSHLFIVITLHGNLSLPRHENSQQFFS